jgi:UDP:flavonoid glycosyltransferase YjiC (YdhE family)
MFTDLERLVVPGQFDLILREAAEKGGYLYSEVHHVPQISIASVSRDSLLTSLREDLVWLNPLRNSLGLAPDRNGHTLSRHLTIVPYPRILLGEGGIPHRAKFVRHENYCFIKGTTVNASILLRSFATSSERPLIVCSPGWVISDAHPELLGILADCFSGTKFDVVIMTGTNRISAADYPGDNVLLIPNGPQAELVKYARCLICHGGLTTVLEALTASVPVLCLPLAGDQFEVSERVKEIGAGRLVSAVSVSRDVLMAELGTITETRRVLE